MVFSGTAIQIALENDQLVMQGKARESSGCVLRGVLNVHLKHPTKIKSITLIFSGTLQASWKQPTKNGHERSLQKERSLIQHRWPFLPPQYSKTHLLPAGDHTYDFELPLPGKLPESSKVSTFYTVHYQLEAIIQRPSFLTNYECQRNVYITRQLNSTVPSSIEPISVNNQWSDKLHYDISIPSKLFHPGDIIPVVINLIPLVSGLKISHLNCTFKEYCSCGPVVGLFDGKSKFHSKILYYIRTNQPTQIKTTNSLDSNGNEINVTNENCTTGDENNANPWCLNLAIPVPKALDEIQCDSTGDGVRVRHQLKFILSMETQNDRLVELRAALPVIIQPQPNGFLPTYDEYDNGQSYPYDPALMVKLLQRNDQSTITDQNQQIPSSIDQTATTSMTGIQTSSSTDLRSYSRNHPPLALDSPSLITPTQSISRLPTYDEVHCH